MSHSFYVVSLSYSTEANTALLNEKQIKLIVVLGELGGRDEYSLVDALKQGLVHKPVVAWVSGTCARLFKSEVQFGHAVSSLPIHLVMSLISA